jgi:methylenetetrahydrofolate dehydrogenase (NADP+)/methenyltetrahydrofolate cyclohydrolase
MKNIDGKKIAKILKEKLMVDISKLKSNNIVPKIVVVLVGGDDASRAYVKMIERAGIRYEVDCEVLELEATVTENELLSKIDELNNNKEVNGVIVQLPLPKHISEKKVIYSLNPDKDLDGFHPLNAGKLAIGDETFIPCTAYGVKKIIEEENIDVVGKHVVVMGRSNIVGKPAAMLLMQMGATVTICHSKTTPLSEYTKMADILIVAIGKKKFVTKEMVKEGAIVIDVGIHADGDSLCGDVDYDDVYDKVSRITPVPGGAGSTTIVMLMDNLVRATKIQTNK